MPEIFSFFRLSWTRSVPVHIISHWTVHQPDSPFSLQPCPILVLLQFVIRILLIFNDLFILEHAWVGGGGAEEEHLQTGSTPSAEPDARLDLVTTKMKSWVLNCLSHPGAPQLSYFLNHVRDDMTPVCFSIASALVFVEWLSGQMCKNIMSGKSTVNSFIRQCGILLGQWLLSQHVYQLFNALMSTQPRQKWNWIMDLL